MDNYSYAKYTQLPLLSYNCVSYLMENNELIWKLLKYGDPDAWNKPNLTREEKGALIYAGQDDTTVSRVFLDVGQPDAWTDESCIIRLAPYNITPENRSIGTVSMMFEVYSHYKINHLSNYTTRIDTIVQIFIETFNGIDIGGLGTLFFDRLGSIDNRATLAGQVPFRGKWILMSTKMG